MVIFRYFPGIVFLMIVLSVYILGRREGVGWGAAITQDWKEASLP